MKDNLLRMQAAVVAIVIACLLLAPAATAMPVPSQTPGAEQDINPVAGGTGEHPMAIVFSAMIYGGLACGAYGIYLNFDNHDDNDDLAMFYIRVGAGLYIIPWLIIIPLYQP